MESSGEVEYTLSYDMMCRRSVAGTSEPQGLYEGENADRLWAQFRPPQPGERGEFWIPDVLRPRDEPHLEYLQTAWEVSHILSASPQ